MELLLVRHALPVRVDNSMTGEKADPWLSDLGREQAEALASWLASKYSGFPPAEVVNLIYSSQCIRARQTAEIIAGPLGADVRVEEGLNEYDAGEAQYIPVEELKAKRDHRWVELRSNTAIPEAESFSREVVSSVERIISAHPGQKIVAVCHGGTIGAYMAHLLGIDRILFYEAIYTSVNRVLAASTGERSVVSLNEIAHLKVARVPIYRPESLE